MYAGRTGCGHHPEVYRYAISPSDGSLTFEAAITWNQATLDVCDTITMVGSYFYISCGFWENYAASGVLPFMAKL
jgi:hypothetical protein